MEKQRDNFLDFCKGYAIFLVILGHVVQFISGNLQDQIFNFIYLFHIPFFFMLSGYLADKTIHLNNLFLLKKIRSLLLPFFSAGLTYALSFDKIPQLLHNPFHAGYWFLLSLFSIWLIFFCVYFIIRYLKIKNIIIEIILLFIPFFTYHFFEAYLPISLIQTLSLGFTFAFYRFFILGYILGKYKYIQDFIFTKFVSCISIILLFTIFILSTNGNITTNIPPTITQTILCISTLAWLKTIYPNPKNKARILLEKWGKYSLNIYIFHYFLIHCFILTEIQNFSPGIQTIINIGISILIINITLILQKPFEINPYLSFFFLGKKDHANTNNINNNSSI